MSPANPDYAGIILDLHGSGPYGKFAAEFEAQQLGTCDEACIKCGSANEPEYFEQDSMKAELKAVALWPNNTRVSGNARAWDNPAFIPFQHFASLLVTLMQPALKDRLQSYMDHAWFPTGPDSPKIVAVHHRHGNGETTGFEQAGKGRRDMSTRKVVKWLQRSAREIAKTFGFERYRVFLASDSEEVVSIWRESDPSLLVFDENGKKQRQGKGFVIAGSDVKLSPGETSEGRAKRCDAETKNSFLEMLLLGYADVLVIGKSSSFNWIGQVMSTVRNAPYCKYPEAGKQYPAFTCFDGKRTLEDVAPYPCVEVGLKPPEKCREVYTKYPTSAPTRIQ